MGFAEKSVSLLFWKPEKDKNEIGSSVNLYQNLYVYKFM